MSLNATITDPSTSTGAKVDTLGHLIVSPETDAINHAANIGGVRCFSENDGPTNFLVSSETNEDFENRVTNDIVEFQYQFNQAAQDTNNWRYVFATMTATLPGTGCLQMGTVQGTTNAHGCTYYTEKCFALYGDTSHYYTVKIQLATATLVANEEVIWGLGTPGSAILTPTDGVYLSLSSAGLYLKNFYNTSADQSVLIAPLASFTVGQTYDVMLALTTDGATVWINNASPVKATWSVANGLPFQSNALPFFVMRRNTGAVSNTSLVRFSNLIVNHSGKSRAFQPWAETQALQGLMGYQGLPGGTIGSTYNPGTISTGSSAFPATAAGSNTAALVTGMGGVAQLTAAASSATDLIICSYQNPVSGVNYLARPIIVTGIILDTMSYGAVVATTPTTLRFELAFGHTAVSMQTAETASFATATTKTPRRIFLGTQSIPVGALAGTPYSNPINTMEFSGAPIVVNPGCFFALIAKCIIGTATASQTAVINFQPIWRWG